MHNVSLEAFPLYFPPKQLPIDQAVKWGVKERKHRDIVAFFFSHRVRP